MNEEKPVSTLFLDIGGVLLTNGWDHQARAYAAHHFDIEPNELEDRHTLLFNVYETGKLSLDEYLDFAVFWKPRQFTRDDFRKCMFEVSRPFQEMIELITSLKRKYCLKTVAVSNEGRELSLYRIDTYGLKTVLDVFISSCFVHYRKPDKEIYRLALDVAHVNAEEVVYIDDRILLVEVARSLGIRSILHTGCDATKDNLAEWGLSI